MYIRPTTAEAACLRQRFVEGQRYEGVLMKFEQAFGFIYMPDYASLFPRSGGVSSRGLFFSARDFEEASEDAPLVAKRSCLTFEIGFKEDGDIVAHRVRHKVHRAEDTRRPNPATEEVRSEAKAETAPKKKKEKAAKQTNVCDLPEMRELVHTLMTAVVECVTPVLEHLAEDTPTETFVREALSARGPLGKNATLNDPRLLVRTLEAIVVPELRKRDGGDTSWSIVGGKVDLVGEQQRLLKHLLNPFSHREAHITRLDAEVALSAFARIDDTLRAKFPSAFGGVAPSAVVDDLRRALDAVPADAWSDVSCTTRGFLHPPKAAAEKDGYVKKHITWPTIADCRLVAEIADAAADVLREHGGEMNTDVLDAALRERFAALPALLARYTQNYGTRGVFNSDKARFVSFVHHTEGVHFMKLRGHVASPRLPTKSSPTPSPPSSPPRPLPSTSSTPAPSSSPPPPSLLPADILALACVAEPSSSSAPSVYDDIPNGDGDRRAVESIVDQIFDRDIESALVDLLRDILEQNTRIQGVSAHPCRFIKSTLERKMSARCSAFSYAHRGYTFSYARSHYDMFGGFEGFLSRNTDVFEQANGLVSLKTAAASTL